jgi:hypothetical protein
MKFRVLVLVLVAAALACPAMACPMCRDTTAGSAPQARKALRLAIPLLGIPALGIFAGALVLAKRIKPGSDLQ